LIKYFPHYIAVLVLICYAMIPVAAQNIEQGTAETICVDDSTFQEYKGKIGRWVTITRKKGVSEYIRLFESTAEEVAEANKDLPVRTGYMFIPFGKTYLDNLKESGLSQSVITSANDQFIWPVADRITISSVLGFRGRNFHTGIDIPAARGAVVRSAMEGQVVYVGYQGGYGHVIDIEHRNSFMTRYAHNTVNLVKKGDFVKKGQVIALAGSTGRSTGSHLHFEIRCNSIPLDPMDFLPNAEKVPAVQNMKNWKFRRK